MNVRFDIPSKFFLNEIPYRVDLHAGQMIGPYKTEKILGSGTFGVVYKVSDNHVSYALKLLKLWEVAHKEQKEAIGERFLREYHAAQTKSDHLVNSKAFGLIENNPFFIMDFIKGGDLRNRIGSLSLQEIQMIGYDTLKGLRDLHQTGIIHRDLKPENVMIEEGGKALITDFGISAFVNHHIKRGTIPNMFGNVKETFGTYAYIAPEQLVSSKKFSTTTPRTDIWSWGVMIYEMFSGGEYPWGPLENESDIADFMRNGKEGNIVDHSVFSKMPPKWADILRQCMQAKFENRIENVDIILHELDAENHIPVHAMLSHTDEINLKILQGVEPERTYKLNPSARNIFNMGRSESNEIEIEDYQTLYISRKHCTIECIPSMNGWFIRDGQWDMESRKWKESTNGTYLNSTRVDKSGSKIKAGDIITIGDTTIKIQAKQ